MTNTWLDWVPAALSFVCILAFVIVLIFRVHDPEDQIQDQITVGDIDLNIPGNSDMSGAKNITPGMYHIIIYSTTGGIHIDGMDYLNLPAIPISKLVHSATGEGYIKYEYWYNGS